MVQKLGISNISDDFKHPLLKHFKKKLKINFAENYFRLLSTLLENVFRLNKAAQVYLNKYNNVIVLLARMSSSPSQFWKFGATSFPL